jgi:hypothetical protein
MVEYWIVPGKLPVLRGEVGANSTEAASQTPQIEQNPSDSSQSELVDEHGYLNGQDSPFFQESEESGLKAVDN